MKRFRITVLLLVLSCMATIVKAEGYLEGMQEHLGVKITDTVSKSVSELSSRKRTSHVWPVLTSL